MAQFRFRLATVLRLRESTRDERLGQLAEAYQAGDKLRLRREAVEQELAELHGLSQQAAVGAVDLDRLLTANRFDAILRAEIQLIRQHENTLGVEIEKRRQALVAADRDVRVLEKLREVKHEQHRQIESALLVKQLDEIAARQTSIAERF
jgi:flagellar export protein FliJ